MMWAPRLRRVFKSAIETGEYGGGAVKVAAPA